MMRCETIALDITGMVWAGVLDVIIIRAMTARTDLLAGKPVIISGYKYRPRV